MRIEKLQLVKVCYYEFQLCKYRSITTPMLGMSYYDNESICRMHISAPISSCSMRIAIEYLTATVRSLRVDSL